MRVFRRFNNNVVQCIDDNGRELVAFGKGIGFHQIPYDLVDMKQVDKTYYGVDKRYLSMINEISDVAFDISKETLDMCRIELNGMINSNMVFTMADHIEFCFERYRKNITIKMPMYYDYANLHPKEIKIANRVLNLIRKKTGIMLGKDEATGIAMNIINAELDPNSNDTFKDEEKIQQEVLKIIESELGVTINKKTSNYARYVMHMRYLIKRVYEKNAPTESNAEMYQNVAAQYPSINRCALKISEYFAKEYKYKFNENELLYLIIHINRLNIREECNQKGITSEE